MKRIDAEELISEVEKHPAIWDIRSLEYRDRMLRKQSWNELSEVFASGNLTAREREELTTELHKKWKNIRDNFLRDIRGKRKSKSETGTTKAPYMHSQQLQFIKEMIESKDGMYTLQESLDTNQESDSSSNKPLQPTPFRQNATKRRYEEVKDKKISPNDSLERSQSDTSENDDNLHFLLSLRQTMSSLPKRLNSKCRLEIMQVLNKYEELSIKDESQQTTNSSRRQRIKKRSVATKDPLEIKKLPVEYLDSSSMSE